MEGRDTSKYFQNLGVTLDRIRKDVIQRDFDAVIVIAGKNNRMGKSTLGLQVSDYIEKGKYSIDRCVFKEEDIYRIWKSIDRGQVMNIDAAEQILLSQDTMSRPSKEFVKNMISAAAKNIVYVITLSNFFKLNNHIKMDKVDLLLYVYKRGHFFVYGRKQIESMLFKWSKTKTKKVFKMPVSHLKDTFSRLENDLWVEYQKNKMTNIDMGIDRRLEEINATSVIMYGVFDAAHILGLTEKEVMDMIFKRIIDAEVNESGRWQISSSEVTKIREMMKQSRIQEKKRIPEDVYKIKKEIA